MPTTHTLNGRYLTITERPNGLRIALSDEGREQLESRQVEPDFMTFATLFEDFAGNGWSMLSAEELGALTGCQLILSPDAEYADNGDLVDAGHVYWHERYQIEDAIEQLLAGELFLIPGDC